ncbi:MAG: hypothetical protein LC792_13240, partial [Actinobacteria bacterium]|nr:hypothetical protein [Actinomycetota bacterium]
MGRTTGVRVRSRALAALLAGGALLLGGCGSTKTDRASISAALVGGKAGFAPAALSVDKGDKVVLQVGNTTDKAHGFNIDGYPVKDRVVEPG